MNNKVAASVYLCNTCHVTSPSGRDAALRRCSLPSRLLLKRDNFLSAPSMWTGQGLELCCAAPQHEHICSGPLALAAARACTHNPPQQPTILLPQPCLACVPSVALQMFCACSEQIPMSPHPLVSYNRRSGHVLLFPATVFPHAQMLHVGKWLGAEEAEDAGGSEGP